MPRNSNFESPHDYRSARRIDTATFLLFMVRLGRRVSQKKNLAHIATKWWSQWMSVRFAIFPPAVARSRPAVRSPPAWGNPTMCKGFCAPS